MNNDDKKTKYPSKNYLHIDGKRIFNKKTRNYVTNPEKVNSHSFYPLLRYINKTEAFHRDEENPDTRPVKTKKRSIMYASHIDNFIYKHYGDELNQAYNRWTKDNLIDENSIAYRSKDNEEGKSNIDYAADVINKIVQLESCYIMIGDFKGYFDNLAHQKLKDRLCKVLGRERNKLTKDWYKVFQSVTKYSYYNQKLIHKHCGTIKQLRQNRQYKYFTSPKSFRNFRRKYPPTPNKKDHGIPQGTAISAVLSNVYAIYFDAQVNQLAQQYSGFYRRYSDDFIVVIPKKGVENFESFKSIKKIIYGMVRDNGMEIEESKTKYFYFHKNKILKLDSLKPSSMDYLGFVFNGQTVSMRSKSPAKFYRHARRLIDKAKKVQAKKGLKKIPYRKQIYKLYTDLGIDRRPFGNFITYAKRSQKTFDRISPNTTNLMMTQIRNRRKKLENMLGYKVTHK